MPFPKPDVRWLVGTKVACPSCLSREVYYDPMHASVVCCGCDYKATDTQLATGEDVWWRRAWRARELGYDSPNRAFRAVCSCCLHHLAVIPGRLSSSDVPQPVCAKCGTPWIATTKIAECLLLPDVMAEPGQAVERTRPGGRRIVVTE